MKTIITFFSLFIYLACSAQDNKIKFGKIDPADLSIKTYKPDTNANAVILNKTGSLKYDALASEYPLTMETYVAIKFLNESAFNEYGQVILEYYAWDDNSKITNVKAVVHLPDGTEVKVENAMIFDEKINDYYSQKKIAFPKLVPGAIVEYQYIVQSKNMFNPVDWFFQSEIPIRYVELTTRIPDWFEYIVLTQGAPLGQNTRTVEYQKISFTDMQRSLSRFQTQSTATINEIDVKYIKYTFINREVPALREEDFITTMDNYFSRIRFRLNAVAFPNSARETILNTWEKVATDLYNDEDWGLQLMNRRPGELVLEAAGIPESNGLTQTQKAQQIYQYINDHVQWNHQYGYGARFDNATLLKAGSASSGNLNKLICAALIQSGISAKPVLISTRDNGNMIELYPFTDQFNHMIILAQLDGKDTWIDAGDPKRPMGIIRPESLNARGWMVDKENPVWIDVNPADSKSVYLFKGKLDTEGNLSGDLEARFTGYHAFLHRQAIDSQKEKYGQNILSCNASALTIDGFEYINTEEITLPLQWKAKVGSVTAATVTPERIYFSPIIPMGYDVNPLNLESRTYPIEINYPTDVSMILDLSLPEGFVVESLPEPIRYVTENGGMTVSYNVTQAGGKLNINMKFVIRKLNYSPEEYSALKAFFDQRKLKFSEQIVLAKA